MRYFFYITLIFLILGDNLNIKAQVIGGYTISDYLVSAENPYGCNPSYVTGLPDDSIWVNFNEGDKITGSFNYNWTDVEGIDLVLETGFHPSNYTVKLKLTSGLFSQPYNVSQFEWNQIGYTFWKHLFTGCTPGTQNSKRYYLPLDFSEDFGLTELDTVTGIEIIFHLSGGEPDFAGAYIVINNPCGGSLFEDEYILCQGDSIVLNATLSNATYQWYNNATTPSYTAYEEGEYWVMVETNLCILSDTFSVVVNPVPSVDLGEDLILCENDVHSINLDSISGSFLWNNGSVNSTYSIDHEGLYWVVVTDGICSGSDSINVYYNFQPDSLFNGDTSVCIGEILHLTFPSQYADDFVYTWQDGSNMSEFEVKYDGIYYLEISNDCWVVNDSIEISFIECDIIVEMPNVFTPNGDGKNDYFIPLELLNLSVEEFVVINRWGQKVYENYNQTVAWDGTYNNRECEEGVYFWKMTFTDKDNKLLIRSGFFHLDR